MNELSFPAIFFLFILLPVAVFVFWKYRKKIKEVIKPGKWPSA